jgi:hypothetical protein
VVSFNSISFDDVGKGFPVKSRIASPLNEVLKASTALVVSGVDNFVNEVVRFSLHFNRWGPLRLLAG